MEYIYTFDRDGLYTGFSPRPTDPVRGTPAQINPLVGTLKVVPTFDMDKEVARFVSGNWVIEAVPVPIPEESPPDVEDTPPVSRRFYGNDKLDLFTPEQQINIVTATMTNPYVKLTYDRLINAKYLTIDDPETEVGLNLLSTEGILSEEEKQVIISKMRERV